MSSAGHAVDERSLRIPPVSADLLPAEIVEARRGRTVRRVVVSFIAAFAVLLGGWYAEAAYQTSIARENLTRAQNDVQSLTREQHRFGELVSTQAESKVIDQQLTALLADDLQWSALLQSVRSAAPAGLEVTGVTGALNPTGTAITGPELPTASNEKRVGTLTVTGTGTNKGVVAAYVDALAKLSRVGNPLLGDVTQQETGWQFTVRLDITKSALGGRYTKSTTGQGGK